MPINCVFMPLIRPEISLLKSWIQYCCYSGEQYINLIVSIDSTWKSSEIRELSSVFNHSKLKEESWSIQFIDCKMSKEESFYIKDPQTVIDINQFPYGQKSGPNMQFFRTSRLVKTSLPTVSAALLMETDAFPLVNNWLHLLNKEISLLPNDTLIAGGNYAGCSALGKDIKSHLNGNSIYFLGHNDFDAFLNGWEKLLLKANHVVPYLAYDIIIPWYMNHKKTNKTVADLKHKDFEIIEHSYNNRLKTLNDSLINYGGHEENQDGFKLDIYKFISDHPHAIIGHGKCFIACNHEIKVLLSKSKFSHPVNISLSLANNLNIEAALLGGFLSHPIVEKLTNDITLLSHQQRKQIAEYGFHNVR